MSERQRRAERAEKLKQVGRRIKKGRSPAAPDSRVKRVVQAKRQHRRRQP